MKPRRGATLAEMAVVMLVAGILLAAAGLLVQASHRLDDGVRRMLAARHAARDAALVLAAELDGLAAPGGDVTLAGDTAVVLRALRGSGVVCGVRGGPALVVRAGLWHGARAVDPARDSLLVFLEGALPWTAATGWVRSGIAGTGGGACDDGAAGLRLDLAAGGDPRLAATPVGAPVRTMETVEYRAYRDAAGDWWLGVRGVTGGAWSVISPVAGVLAPRGLTLTALDSSGLPATTAPFASVRIVVRAQWSPRADTAELIAALSPE